MIPSNGHILIVDDSSDIQYLLGQLFMSESFKVSYASTGLEALDILRNSSQLPDIILLDLMMPEMDGFRFLDEQTRNARISQIPVIVMTADGNRNFKKLNLPANAFLKKPFLDPEVILNAVRQLLPRS